MVLTKTILRKLPALLLIAACWNFQACEDDPIIQESSAVGQGSYGRIGIIVPVDSTAAKSSESLNPEIY